MKEIQKKIHKNIFFEKRYISLYIFLLALAMRLAFVTKSGDIPLSDAALYDRLAVTISQGKGYIDSDGTPHSTHPPFYPIFLAIIYKFFGHNYLVARIIQSLLGAFSCVLIYLIGSKMYSHSLGLAAASISIVYFPFIKSAGLLLTELVFTFLMLLIVFYLLKIEKGDTGLKNYIIAGILLGVSMLTRPVMLFFPLFIIPVLFYAEGKRIPVVLKKYLVVILFLIFPILPWIIRNYNIYHEIIPVTSEAGKGFYVSYFPSGGIFGNTLSSSDPIVIEGSEISSSIIRTHFFVKKTMDFIVENPVKFLTLEFKKILYFWAPFDWEIVGGRWFNFMYVTVFPFFVVGFLLAIRRFKKNYVILLPIIYFQIITLVFYGSPRFRLPIEPYIFILAANGILYCWKRMFAGKEI